MAAGGGGGEIFTLEQSGDDIVIRRGPQVIRYKLDGSESVDGVAGPGGWNHDAFKSALGWI